MTEQPDINRPYQDNSTEDEPAAPAEQPPIITPPPNAQPENCTIELPNNFKISLTSSTLQANQLCEICNLMIEEYNNGSKPKSNSMVG